MKHGYTCQCGWRLKREMLTRREYALLKEQHAQGTFSKIGCEALTQELKQSRKVPSK